MQAGKGGVRSAVVRLPLYVYDKTGTSFSRIKEEKAVERNVSSYISERELHSVSHADFGNVLLCLLS